MKILHTADLHLQEKDDRRWAALQELVELACRKQVDLLVISGDLFDRQVDGEMLRPRLRQIITAGDFTTFIIPGNHDRGVYGEGLYFGDKVRIIANLDKPVDTGSALIWGLPYETYSGEQVAYRLQGLAEKLSREVPNILLYHGELLDAYFSRWEWGEEGEQRYMPVKLAYFQNVPFDYVLAGHFHSRFAVWDLPEGGFFVYPGSPVAITAREKGQRKANLFRLGEPPGENLLETFHLEPIEMILEPEKGLDPPAMLGALLSKTHPLAEILLTVKGFINSRFLGLSEQELVDKINRIAGSRLYKEAEYLFMDIANILEDNLYKKFTRELEQIDCPPQEKRRIQEMVIRAFAGAFK